MRRQFQPVSPETSIEPDSHSGRGTQRERRSDNGLTHDVQNVISVRRADKVDRAPISETREDLIAPSFIPVSARSGNSSEQHDEADEDSDLAFDSINDDFSAPAIPTVSGKTILIAAAAIGAFFWLSKR